MDLEKIILRSSHILGIEIEEQAASEIAKRSRGTPRVANRLLRRIRDFAQVNCNGTVNMEITQESLLRLDVDEVGLDDMDKRILDAIINKFGGGPVGVNTLAIAVGEPAETLEEVYEPFLIKEGFLNRTPRGRMATDLAFTHLGLTRKTDGQENLF